MNIKLLIPVIIFSFCIPVTSLEVDVDELKSKKVEFQNYRGQPRKVDPVRGINLIGEKLARGTRRRGANRWFRYHNKYSILRAVSQKDKEKLSADIFSVDRNARVNHIKNIRRITRSYLQSMYGYSFQEARALALFTTYYNAVHRRDITYFKSKYKGVVIKHINSSNAGISTKYYQWPGRTRMIIPLTEEDKRGKIRKVDPFIITDDKTRKLSRKDGDNLKERKDIIDLQKKKVQDDKRKAEDERRKLEEKKKRIADEKKRLEEKQDRLNKEKEKIKDEKKQAEKIKDPVKKKEKQDEIKKKEDDLKKKEETAKKEKEKIEEKEKETQKEEDKQKETEDEIEKKKERIKDEEKELKEDEKKKGTEETLSEDELKKKEDELAKKEEDLDKREDKLRDEQLDKNIYASKLYYLKIRQYLSGGHYNNEMYMINPKTRKVLFKSPINNICGKRYDVFSDGVVVITHLGNHRSGHRLTLLDRNTLKPIRNGTDDVFWRSFIEIRDNHIYVIMEQNGQYYLGKYDSKFKLVARSNEWINENTFISFFDEYIYINRKDKQIMVLKKEDLTLVDMIKP